MVRGPGQGRRLALFAGLVLWGERPSCGRPLDRHFADKTKALACDCAQQPLILAGIVDGAANGVDPACQRRLRDDAAVPHIVEQLILSYDAVSMLKQI